MCVLLLLLLSPQVKQLLVDALYGADHEQQHVEEALDILRSSLSSVDADAAPTTEAAAAAVGSSQGTQSSSNAAGGTPAATNGHATAGNSSSNGNGSGARTARGTSSQAASAV
jgi:hypothetical protein